MRIWAATRDMDKIIKEVVMDFPAAHSEGEWNAVLGDICRELDLSRPVLLKKHLNELNTFRHTAFLPSDFMEGVDFSKFTLQLSRKRRKSNFCPKFSMERFYLNIPAALCKS